MFRAAVYCCPAVGSAAVFSGMAVCQVRGTPMIRGWRLSSVDPGPGRLRHLDCLGLESPLLSLCVTPMAGDRLVTCHRDLHPDNVLVDASGELAVLDWDDAGPACPGRELAGLLMFWHGRDDGTADDAAVRQTLAAYRAAGGPGRLRDEQSFGMYIAGRLNFLEDQASLALDPDAAPEHRAYASSEIADTLARLRYPA